MNDEVCINQTFSLEERYINFGKKRYYRSASGSDESRNRNRFGRSRRFEFADFESGRIRLGGANGGFVFIVGRKRKSVSVKGNYMYLSNLFLMILSVFAISTENPSANQLQLKLKPNAAVSKTPSKIIITKKNTAQKGQVSMPQVKEFGVQAFMRWSDTRDSSGIMQAPFNYVEIVNTFFNVQPKTGEKVTVVPLQNDFEPFELKITSIKKADFIDCNAKPPGTVWDIEFEKSTRKDFLEIKSAPNRSPEFPFDIFVIYPSVKFARKIDVAGLKKTMIPKGVYLNTITAAIDLTGDGKPDLLETSYCCGNEKMSSESCDYTCGVNYKKIKNIWKKVKYNSSCT